MGGLCVGQHGPNKTTKSGDPSNPRTSVGAIANKGKSDQIFREEGKGGLMEGIVATTTIDSHVMNVGGEGPKTVRKQILVWISKEKDKGEMLEKIKERMMGADEMVTGGTAIMSEEWDLAARKQKEEYKELISLGEPPGTMAKIMLEQIKLLQKGQQRLKQGMRRMGGVVEGMQERIREMENERVCGEKRNTNPSNRRNWKGRRRDNHRQRRHKIQMGTQQWQGQARRHRKGKLVCIRNRTLLYS